MEITIFKDITTEEALVSIEKESEKYEGLYVEMDDKEQRKFVKDSASVISGMLKRLDRARIDKSKEYKLNIEAEAASIKDRLDTANKPLTELLDAHKEKRAKELAAIKKIEDDKQAAIQKEEDHEQAITLDKIKAFEIKEAIQIQRERDEAIAKEAAEQAKQAEISRQEFELAKQEAEKAKLEANKKHVGSVRGEIKEHLIKSCKIDEDLAVKIVKALLKTERITINY